MELRSELLHILEKIQFLLGYHTAFFDKGARFRSPSTSAEAKQATRFIEELHAAAEFIRSLLSKENEHDMDLSRQAAVLQIEKEVQAYIEARMRESKESKRLSVSAVVDVGERLLGFVQERKRNPHKAVMEKLAA